MYSHFTHASADLHRPPSLEDVAQELLDLREEHESTINDFDFLQRKYEIALQALAELPDSIEETRRLSYTARPKSRSRPKSFMPAYMAAKPSFDNSLKRRSLPLGFRPDDDASEITPEHGDDDLEVKDDLGELESTINPISSDTPSSDQRPRPRALSSKLRSENHTHTATEPLDERNGDNKFAVKHPLKDTKSAIGTTGIAQDEQLVKKMERLKRLDAEMGTRVAKKKAQVKEKEPQVIEEEPQDPEPEPEPVSQPLQPEENHQETFLHDDDDEELEAEVAAPSEIVAETNGDHDPNHEAKDNLNEPQSAISTVSTMREEQLVEEMERLRKLDAEKEAQVAELTSHFTQLQEQHQDTLEYIEELKAEVQKASSNTGRSSPTAAILRRKERGSVLSERANRSFAAMRNMVFEQFEDEPDKVQAFENNMSAAMTEFHLRSERVRELESELGQLKKDMDSKMTIINGLTRERSSMKASPLDMSAIAKMQEQLTETENRMRSLSGSYALREKELLDQIDHLQHSLTSSANSAASVTDSSDRSVKRESIAVEDHQRQVNELQKEVADWRSKHDSAMESMKASEKQFLATISDLEVNLKHAEEHSVTSRAVSPQENGEVQDAVVKKHEETIAALQKEIDEHKVAASHTATKLVEMEQNYTKILTQVEEDVKSRELTEKELSTHRDLVANLEHQLEAHQTSLASHQESLETLTSSHAKELDDVKAEALKAQTESNEKLEKALSEHKLAADSLKTELDNARSSDDTTKALEEAVTKSKDDLSNLMADAAMILGKPTSIRNLTSHLQTIINARKDISSLHQTASDELQTVRAELETLKEQLSESNSRNAEVEKIKDETLVEVQQIRDLANNSSRLVEELQKQLSESNDRVEKLRKINEETLNELQQISDQERKSSRLVEELEEQLNSNFDQAQVANNRLSALQTERQVFLQEAIQAKEDLEKERDELKGRVTALEAQLDKQRSITPTDALARSNSNGGQGGLVSRKSIPASNTSSLPSPPPAIPLPPLPANGAGPAPSTTAPSPPTSRHASKDMATSQLVEDQEARIRTIEKHLFAEKQLTATLEEALTDLESSSTKMKTECDQWRRKCVNMEDEVLAMRKEKQNARLSVQQMEDDARRRIDAERVKLEERMKQLQGMTQGGKKKKSSINCF